MGTLTQPHSLSRTLGALHRCSAQHLAVSVLCRTVSPNYLASPPTDCWVSGSLSEDMHLSRYLVLLPVLARATCPADYIEAPFGKCYRVVATGGGFGGFHFQCSALCGSDASLACITNEEENSWLASLVNTSDVWPPLALRNAWIGNYQNPVDQGAAVGWTQCSNGRSTDYTHWFKNRTGCTDYARVGSAHDDCWMSGAQMPDQPNEYTATTMSNGQTTEDCAALHPHGWSDERCAWRRFPCLCEHGTPTSSAYEAWVQRLYPVWNRVYIRNSWWGMGISVAIAILPTLVLMARSVCCSSSQKTWVQRVRSRVRHSWLALGWCSMVIGLAPLIMWLLGRQAAPILGNMIYYLLLLVVGLFAFTLAIIPNDSKALCWVVPFFGSFYVLSLAIGAFFASWGWPNVNGWRTSATNNFILGIILVLASLASLILIVSTRRLADARAKLDRVWIALRLWGVFLFVNLLVQALLEFANRFDGGPYLTVALTALVCSGVATAKVRAFVCKHLATLGHGGQDRFEALAAAKLIWVDVSQLPVSNDTELASNKGTSA